MTGDGVMHAVELDARGMSLTAWVVREGNPEAGRFAVFLLCLNCYRIEHGG
jgi:hypothetical protein